MIRKGDIMPSPAARAAVSHVRQAAPGFVPRRVLHESDTHVLLSGTMGSSPVVAKCLTLPNEPRSTDRFRRERAAYHAFAQHRPPLPVPRLVRPDTDSDVLLLEYVRTRYDSRGPNAPWAAAVTLHTMLRAVRMLNAWRPPLRSFEAPLDYRARIAALQGLGQLAEREADDLGRLLGGLKNVPRQFCHGRPSAAHLVQAEAGATLVDWGHAGWYLPGHDLAVLWSGLEVHSPARHSISRLARAPGTKARDSFLINLTLTLSAQRSAQRFGPMDDDQWARNRNLEHDLALTACAVRAACSGG